MHRSVVTSLSVTCFMREHGYKRARRLLEPSVLMNPTALTSSLVISMAISAMTTSAAIAHGGGLDSQGCHTNRTSATRHCHGSGGTSAQHISLLLSGPVSLTSVGDGDTVRVTSHKGEKVTIRLACIDAPETTQGASGKWSTQALRRMVEGKSMQLKPHAKERYERIVAEIYVGNRNINLQMVQLGAAYVYRRYLSQCDADAYLRAEAIAARNGLGVWGSYKPAQVPWEYRRLRRR